MVLTVPEGTDQTLLKSMMDYLRYLQATSKSKATQKFVDQLADEISSSWWKTNRKRYVK